MSNNINKKSLFAQFYQCRINIKCPRCVLKLQLSICNRGISETTAKLFIFKASFKLVYKSCVLGFIDWIFFLSQSIPYFWRPNVPKIVKLLKGFFLNCCRRCMDKFCTVHNNLHIFLIEIYSYILWKSDMQINSLKKIRRFQFKEKFIYHSFSNRFIRQWNINWKHTLCYLICFHCNKN